MTAVVSVIVPVFNVEPYLTQCLESIVGQTYPHLEIILVNDGSTDGSAEIVGRFAERDDRIHGITQANAGVSAARNAGLDAATGEFVMFVDADDWLEPYALELTVTEAISKNLDFVTFGYAISYPHKSIDAPPLTDFQGTLDTRAGLETVLTTQNRFVFTRLYLRSLVGATRFREDIHWGEDTIFVVEVARRAHSSTVVHRPLYHYVQSEGSATRSTANPKRLTGPKMTEVLEELVQDKHPHLVDHVLQTRVNILSILVQDVAQLPRSQSSAMVKEFTYRLRSDLPRVLRSRAITPRTKLKAVLVGFAPRLFAASSRVITKFRTARD